MTRFSFLFWGTVVRGNDPNCWGRDGRSWLACCDPKFGSAGNRLCWDGLWSYSRCCATFHDTAAEEFSLRGPGWTYAASLPNDYTRKKLERLRKGNGTTNNPRGLVSKEDREFLQWHNWEEKRLEKLEDEEGEACAPGMYQQFKFEANHYYERNTTHWSLLQTQG